MAQCQRAGNIITLNSPLQQMLGDRSAIATLQRPHPSDERVDAERLLAELFARQGNSFQIDSHTAGTNSQPVRWTAWRGPARSPHGSGHRCWSRCRGPWPSPRPVLLPDLVVKKASNSLERVASSLPLPLSPTTKSAHGGEAAWPARKITEFFSNRPELGSRTESQLRTGSQTFNHILEAQAPRLIQFALKFSF
ncbi:MAG TPA: hypothetical protein VIX37_04585 [Candidatus Sulfotelmatobacter sp.]